MMTSDLYNLHVSPETRNHKGCFVRNTLYRLAEITPTGWAVICQDKATCHWVDPDNLSVVDENEIILSEEEIFQLG